METIFYLDHILDPVPNHLVATFYSLSFGCYIWLTPPNAQCWRETRFVYPPDAISTRWNPPCFNHLSIIWSLIISSLYDHHIVTILMIISSYDDHHMESGPGGALLAWSLRPPPTCNQQPPIHFWKLVVTLAACSTILLSPLEAWKGAWGQLLCFGRIDAHPLYPLELQLLLER